MKKNGSAFAKLVGDEIYSLYEFSKFLEFNFVLNLVIWSFNDDNYLDSSKNLIAKNLVNRGLNYLRKWDFMKALFWRWDDKIKQPKISLV